jgi:hypothetical protein
VSAFSAGRALGVSDQNPSQIPSFVFFVTFCSNALRSLLFRQDMSDKDDYLATGFRNVDGAKIEKMVRCLDALQSMESTEALAGVMLFICHGRKVFTSFVRIGPPSPCLRLTCDSRRLTALANLRVKILTLSRYPGKDSHGQSVQGRSSA